MQMRNIRISSSVLENFFVILLSPAQPSTVHLLLLFLLRHAVTSSWEPLKPALSTLLMPDCTVVMSGTPGEVGKVREDCSASSSSTYEYVFLPLYNYM